MTLLEETIAADLDLNGQLQLSRTPTLPAGPVQVTIRAATGSGSRRCLADVIREIAADQRARGFPGRSAADVQADTAQSDEDDERDRELDAARRAGGPGGCP